MAQLDSASVFGTEGWGFESLQACIRGFDGLASEPFFIWLVSLDYLRGALKTVPVLRRVEPKGLLNFGKIGDESAVFSPYFPFFVDILAKLYLCLS